MAAPKENFKRSLAQIGLGGGSRSLGWRLYKVARQVEKAAWEAQRQTALVIDQAVVLGTPVDTGRARSNWRVSVGSASRGTIDPYAPGRKLGLGEGANAQAAINQGLQALAGSTGGKAIHIGNNVHYIGKLENGHSPQNRGFVKAAILEGKVLLKKFTLLSLQRRLNLGN